MNAVEIEEAVSELARTPFDPDEFPFAFLAAFGNKDATLKRLPTPQVRRRRRAPAQQHPRRRRGARRGGRDAGAPEG